MAWFRYAEPDMHVEQVDVRVPRSKEDSTVSDFLNNFSFIIYVITVVPTAFSLFVHLHPASPSPLTVSEWQIIEESGLNDFVLRATPGKRTSAGTLKNVKSMKEGNNSVLETKFI